MVEVQFDIAIDDDSQDDPILDEYELEMMLQHTREQITRHVQQSLEGLRCEKHGEPPKVHVSGTYSRDTEQLEVSYHVDTCCKPFLMKAVMALNSS